jgi:hypothetical protein
MGEYAMYVDGNGPAEITLKLTPGRYALTWMDVATGATTGQETFAHSGGDRVVKSPDFRNGIAMRLRRN